MIKAELVQRISRETGLAQAKAEQVVEAMLNEIKHALQQGESIILRGFGSFQVRQKPARIGRNPKTGQDAAIPPHRVVRFKSGSQFKAAVNASTSEPIVPRCTVES